MGADEGEGVATVVRMGEGDAPPAPLLQPETEETSVLVQPGETQTVPTTEES